MKLSSIKRRRPRIVMSHGHPFDGWTVEQYRSGMSTRRFPLPDAIAFRNVAIDAKRYERIEAAKRARIKASRARD